MPEKAKKNIPGGIGKNPIMKSNPRELYQIELYLKGRLNEAEKNKRRLSELFNRIF